MKKLMLKIYQLFNSELVVELISWLISLSAAGVVFYQLFKIIKKI